MWEKVFCSHGVTIRKTGENLKLAVTLVRKVQFLRRKVAFSSSK